MGGGKSTVWETSDGCASLCAGLLAGVVWMGLGTIVTALLGRGLLLSPTTVSATPTAGFLLLQIGIDLVEGISILRLYAAIRPRYGAGAKTALIAAFA